MLMLRIEWERDDASFMFVAPVARHFAPMAIWCSISAALAGAFGNGDEGDGVDLEMK